MPTPLKQSLTRNLETKQPYTARWYSMHVAGRGEGRRLAPAQCVSAWAFQKALLGVAPQLLCPELTECCLS